MLGGRENPFAAAHPSPGLARGLGLGGLLLRHAFAAFAARGRDTVGLGVDTANATGAPALYARHGLTVHYAVDTWEAVLK